VLLLPVEASTRPFHHALEVGVGFIESVSDDDERKVIDKPSVPVSVTVSSI